MKGEFLNEFEKIVVFSFLLSEEKKRSIHLSSFMTDGASVAPVLGNLNR